MSTEAAPPLAPREVPIRAAVIAAFVCALLLAILVHPLIGAALGVVAAAVLTRPFDPPLALAALACVASFANYEGGRLTRDLSFATVLALYALTAVVLARAAGRWRAPGGRFVLALLAFLAWTGLCTVRGVAAGYPLRGLGIEVMALGMLGYAWLAGGLTLRPEQLQSAQRLFVATGLVHVGIGVWSYAVNHVRTGGIWYTPLPGMLAIFALAKALRSESAWSRRGWTLLFGLFLLHQTISFSRGYWLGLLVGIPFTVWVFAGRGDGARRRWRRVGAVASMGALLLVLATSGIAVVFGWSDLPRLLYTRFGSSFATKNSSESASNVERLLEYAASARYISRSPWIGHGIGLELRIRNPIVHAVQRQCYVHQTYLWIWLKEGLLGVILLLGMTFEAVRLGVRGARAPDPRHAVWALTSAGATVYLAVVNMTTFHLSQINATTLQAVLWGFTLALSRPPHWRVVWRRPAERPAR